jgi:hypothetical protein
MSHASPMPGVNTIQESYNKAMKKQSNTKTLFKPKMTEMNASPTPHHHHHTNVLTLSYTLRPGTITQYLIGSKNNTLEVTMKKPSGNPKMRTGHQNVLMKPHPKHKETLHHGGIYLEDSMNGSCDQDGLIGNNLEMKRTFRNEVAMQRLTWIIWSQGLVDIKEALRYCVL